MGRAAATAAKSDPLLPDPTVNMQKLQAVRRYLRARRLREKIFPSGLFADPAWDILLGLYAASLEEKPLAVSSACDAAVVPTTTALRWLSRLAESRLIERRDDAHDQRRSLVRLTPEGWTAVDKWVESCLVALFPPSAAAPALRGDR